MHRVLLAGLVVLAPSPALTQLSPEYPDSGFMSGVPAALTTATSACVTEFAPSEVEGVVLLGCSVAAVDTVRLESGSRVLSVRYLRWVRDRDRPWEDSTRVDELVLFEVDEVASTAMPVWHRVGFHNFIGRVDLDRHGVTDLLQVFNCVRGTGGCVEDVLARIGESWRVVELAFIDELEPHLPVGYRLHKGRRIDLSTLEFEQPIATFEDPNCCPSASLVGALRLEGLRLLLDSVHVERRLPAATLTPAPPDAPMSTEHVSSSPAMGRHLDVALAPKTAVRDGRGYGR